MGFFDRFRKNRTAEAGARHHTAVTPPRTLRDHATAAPHALAVPTTAPADRSFHLVGTPRFVVLDVETTGLGPEQHRILELAMVTTDPWGRVLEEWTTRLNPQGSVGATHIHGIAEADVAHAPVFTDVITQINARLTGAAVCAHNARFDLAFLRAEYARAGWALPFVPALCTLEASTHHLPMLDRRRLADCCSAVGTPLRHAHSALGDARAAAGLLAAFMHPHVGLPPRPADLELPRAAQSVVWPTEATQAPTQRASRPAPPARVRRQLAKAAAAGPVPSLVELVKNFSLVDALDEGAPAGSLIYLEKLAEVLEDGQVTAEEAADLVEVAQAHELSEDDVATANRAFVLALAHEALKDGKVTRAERAELKAVGALLGVDDKVVPDLLAQAEQARHTRLSANLGPLPDPWTHGEPLRVGDKVVFTGCDEQQREQLEKRSEELGVRVLGAVSAKSAMLVSDGAVDGTKAAKARDLGIRVVEPEVYAALLQHLQPSPERKPLAGRPALAPVPALDAVSHQMLDEAPVIASESAEPAWSPAEVRRWARENGWTVGERGRLPAPLLQAYADAHTDDVATGDVAPV